MPFPIIYARACHSTPYLARHLPQLESRPLHIRYTSSPLPWAAFWSSSCRRTWAKRSRGQKGLNIWSKRMLSNPHPYPPKVQTAYSLLAQSWSPVPRHFIWQQFHPSLTHMSLPTNLTLLPLLNKSTPFFYHVRTIWQKANPSHSPYSILFWRYHKRNIIREIHTQNTCI